MVECSPRATQGNEVNPRTRPCPDSLGFLAVLPWVEVSLVEEQPLKGATVGNPAPAQAGCPGLATHRPFGQAGCGSNPSQGAPPSEWPRCWETLCKTVLLVLQTWRHPGPEGHCKEPSPLIRTGRLGPRPPQARADFSGRKTCKVFPVCSPGMQPAGASEASHFPWLRGWHSCSCLPGPGTLWALGRDC